jgi:hypothetical protein
MEEPDVAVELRERCEVFNGLLRRANLGIGFLSQG